MSRFAGRGVLVTGASRGLGRAIAEAFGREGARVYVGFRTREQDAAQVVAAIRASGGQAEPSRFDVRDAEQVEAAIERADAGDGLQVLVNNAGLVADAAFPGMTTRDWDDLMAVDLRGPFLCARAAARRMIGRRRGAIVNIASVAAVKASPGQAAYAAAKGGVLALTRTLAAELAPRGVRVNAVVPGLLATGMGARLDHRRVATVIGAIPLGRVGDAEEVARVVTFLASDDASYLVGQAIAADGGLSL